MRNVPHTQVNTATTWHICCGKERTMDCL